MMRLQFIEAKRQAVWNWPAVLNFAIGGAGCGLYLMSFVGQDALAAPGSLLKTLRLLGPACVGVGFVALTFEAGRTQRAIWVLANLRTSWMAREALCAVLFTVAAVLDWFFQRPALAGLAAASAVLFIVSQGFMVYGARAVSAWNTRWVPLQFLTSALAAGSGLWLMAVVLMVGAVPGVEALWTAVALLLLDAAVWFGYVGLPRAEGFRVATQALRRPRVLYGVGGVRLLPAGILVGLALTGRHWNELLVGWWFILAGATMLGGVIAQKRAMLNWVGYLRSIAVDCGADVLRLHPVHPAPDPAEECARATSAPKDVGGPTARR